MNTGYLSRINTPNPLPTSTLTQMSRNQILHNQNSRNAGSFDGINGDRSRNWRPQTSSGTTKFMRTINQIDSQDMLYEWNTVQSNTIDESMGALGIKFDRPVESRSIERERSASPTVSQSQ